MIDLIKTFGVQPTQEETKELIANNNLTIPVNEKSSTLIKLVNQSMEYIEKVVNENIKGKDSKIENIPFLNGVKLENYIIQYGSNNNYIHIVDKYTNFKYGTFSLGNEKLTAETGKQWLIFNVAQIVTCVNATNCKFICYANKFPTTLKGILNPKNNSRLKNIILTMFSNFEQIFNEVIQFVKQTTFNKLLVRFHEAGDIYSKNYFNKLINIMESNKDTQFLFYTRTIFTLDKINYINSLNNCLMRFSLDNSTPKEVIEKVHALNCPTFIIIDKDDIIRAVKELDNKFICNVKQGNKTKLIARYEEIETELQKPRLKGKGTRQKLKTERINILDTIKNDSKCSKCMKCFSKNLNNIFVLTH